MASPSRRLGSVAQGSVAQTAELPALTRDGAGSTPAGATKASLAMPTSRSRGFRRVTDSFGKDCHRRGIPSRKRVGSRALGVRLPLLPLAEPQRRLRCCEEGMPTSPARPSAAPSWKGSALLPRRRRAVRRFESCCLRLSFRRGRVGKTRDCYSREAGSSPAAGADPSDARAAPARPLCGVAESTPWAPVVEVAMTPGPQPGSCGFESRRGYWNVHLAVGELATPPASGAGDRRFDSCQPD
jgi:hypothetical protein